MTFRNTLMDGPHIGAVVDPSWLLAPLFARDAAGLDVGATELPGNLLPSAEPASVDPEVLAQAAADWPAWWTGACEFRPGPPAPRTLDLVHFSPALTALWTPVERAFDRWRRTRPAPPSAANDKPREAEHLLLNDFQRKHGRPPVACTLRILEIPVEGSYLHSPARGMLIVSAILRHDPDRYPDLLEPLLPEHF